MATPNSHVGAGGGPSAASSLAGSGVWSRSAVVSGAEGRPGSRHSPLVIDHHPKTTAEAVHRHVHHPPTTTHVVHVLPAPQATTVVQVGCQLIKSVSLQSILKTTPAFKVFMICHQNARKRSNKECRIFDIFAFGNIHIVHFF